MNAVELSRDNRLSFAVRCDVREQPTLKKMNLSATNHNIAKSEVRLATSIRLVEVMDNYQQI